MNSRFARMFYVCLIDSFSHLWLYLTDVEYYAETLPADKRFCVLRRHYRLNRASSSEEAATRCERLAATADQAAIEEACSGQFDLWQRQASMFRGWASRIRRLDGGQTSSS